MRGSSSPVQVVPSFAMSFRIERNFSIVKRRPCSPIRVCRKITGPGPPRRRTAIAAPTISGEASSSPTVASSEVERPLRDRLLVAPVQVHGVEEPGRGEALQRHAAERPLEERRELHHRHVQVQQLEQPPVQRRPARADADHEHVDAAAVGDALQIVERAEARRAGGRAGAGLGAVVDPADQLERARAGRDALGLDHAHGLRRPDDDAAQRLAERVVAGDSGLPQEAR